MPNYKRPFSAISFIILALVVFGLGFFLVKYFVMKSHQATTIPKVEQAQGALIPGFPNFPLYPSATITSTQQTDATTSPEYAQPSYQAYLQTVDAPSQIMNWYSQNLPSIGWKIVRPVDDSQPDDQNLVVANDTMTATINAETEADEGTTISIFIRQNGNNAQ